MGDSLFAHRRCRVCAGDLTEVLNLGKLRLNAFPLHPAEVEKQMPIPHILAVCRGCTLCQLVHTTPADWMFREYWYRSSVNEMMQRELKEIAAYAVDLLGRDLLEDDWILDIGANDGTLLRAYQTLFPRGNGDYSCRWTRVAIEPALNFEEDLKDCTTVALTGYFPTNLLDGKKRGFKIITAIAMCYDLEKPLDFFLKIAELLHPSGIAIVQFQDLQQQMACAAFDNIVAEHLEYYTLTSLAEVVTAAGLYPVACTQTPINGGSLRVTLKRGYLQPKDWDTSVLLQLNREAQAHLSKTAIRHGLVAFDRFRWRVDEAKRLITNSIELAQRHGTVSGYGASTKGNTLLQVLKLGPAEIHCIADRSPAKHGRYTVTGIPIVSEEEWRQLVTPVTLVPIWQFKAGVLRREHDYLTKGGTFLFPLPYSTAVSYGRA
jgi:NDP-4-keto-2,6-dideoxyhexose 3-C-methyltransferase